MDGVLEAELSDVEAQEVEQEVEESEDELSGVDDEADILNDPDFQNMSDSEGDDLPLFADLSDDERSDEEGEEGTYRAREKRSKKAKVRNCLIFTFLVLS